MHVEEPGRAVALARMVNDALSRIALERPGADHLPAGSDYPHMIGSLEQMTASIGRLELSEADRAAILGANAARLPGL